MIPPKKRTLNEIRQTKDTFYVVPELKKKDSSQELFNEFFNSSNDKINSSNYCGYSGNCCICNDKRHNNV